MLVSVILCCIFALETAIAYDCNKRIVQYGTVCVCNSSYCDTVPKVKISHPEEIVIVSTSDTNPGFNLRRTSFSKRNTSTSNVMRINKRIFQKIFGFGGAFTDATGININSLPKPAQIKLLESYFGDDGIEYSLCRVPLGGSDFSPRPYSYVDKDGDDKLEYFKLQLEDFSFKIPLIKTAKSLRGRKQLDLITSPWTAPPWMKTVKVWSGFSMLKPENYQLFVDYIIKYLDEYRKLGIKFWALTTGNEPMNGFRTTSEMKINSMGWIPEDQSRWIRENLGPSLKKSPHKNVKIIVHDDDRLTIPHVVPLLFNNNETLKYISGVGVHWYWDTSVPPEVLDLAKTDKKDVFLLSTEACIFLEGVSLGDWKRGAKYAKSIIEYLEFGSTGWVEWNMALNLNGGPTYIDYVADSPIIVNKTAGEFYKQPMFYAMGHFSKFVVPGSIRLGIDGNFTKGGIFEAMAFSRPDGLIAIVVLNSGIKNISFEIENAGGLSSIIDIEGNSIITVLYREEKNTKGRKKYA